MINVDPDRLKFFYGTTPQPCPYLPGKTETKAITELAGQDPSNFHDLLSQAGFRRSHSLAYNPACPSCTACVPARVRVSDFKASKSMRRILRKNVGLTGFETPPIATAEQFLLFQKYEKARHSNGEMAGMNFDDFKAMVEESPVQTKLVEYRTSTGELQGAALTDTLSDGISGVYTFFSPNYSTRSLGTFLILSQIFRTQKLDLPYFYLGYWVQQSPKMSYKQRFLPMEILTESGWSDYNPLNNTR